VGFFEIPDFPKPPANQVTFDIDLKRTVDGPTGVSIVGVPAISRLNNTVAALMLASTKSEFHTLHSHTKHLSSASDILM
jgi:hypothetical protein